MLLGDSQVGEFVKDGVLLKELKLLTGLAGGRHLTHVELAVLAGMSPAMVNNYISRLRQQGHVRRVGTSSRTSHYELTQDGINHREILLVNYNAELIRLYKAARCEIADRINALFRAEPVRICLCPAGDTAEVVVSVLSESPNIYLDAVCDDSVEKQSLGLAGHRVLPFEELCADRLDGALVATIGFGDAIEARVREATEDNIRVWRLF